jgi:hypothetical protein
MTETDPKALNTNHHYRQVNMSTAGPELPPHLLAKRKRLAEEEEAAQVSSNASSNSRECPNGSDGAEKRQRVIGPAPPPAALKEKPTDTLNDSGEDSSSDDEIGPSLPSASEYTVHATLSSKVFTS